MGGQASEDEGGGYVPAEVCELLVDALEGHGWCVGVVRCGGVESGIRCSWCGVVEE